MKPTTKMSLLAKNNVAIQLGSRPQKTLAYEPTTSPSAAGEMTIQRRVSASVKPPLFRLAFIQIPRSIACRQIQLSHHRSYKIHYIELGQMDQH
jgi:hypothetical protein